MKIGSSILLPIALLTQAWQAQGQLSTTPAAPSTTPAAPRTTPAQILTTTTTTTAPTIIVSSFSYFTTYPRITIATSSWSISEPRIIIPTISVSVPRIIHPTTSSYTTVTSSTTANPPRYSSIISFSVSRIIVTTTPLSTTTSSTTADPPAIAPATTLSTTTSSTTAIPPRYSSIISFSVSRIINTTPLSTTTSSTTANPPAIATTAPLSTTTPSTTADPPRYSSVLGPSHSSRSSRLVTFTPRFPTRSVPKRTSSTAPVKITKTRGFHTPTTIDIPYFPPVRPSEPIYTEPHYTSPASPITNWDPPFHTALNHRSEGHISEAELSGDYVPDEDADRISNEVRDEVPSLEEGLTDGGSIPDAAFGGMPPAET